MSEDRSAEMFLSHLRASQMAILYAMIESGVRKLENVPDDEIPGDVRQGEALLRRIEMFAHADGCYNFISTLVPAAQSALTRTGFL